MVTIFIILIIIRLAKGEEKKGEVLARLDQLTKERKQLLVSICGNNKKEEEKSKKYDNLKKKLPRNRLLFAGSEGRVGS